MQPFFQQNARNKRANAKSKVDDVLLKEFQGGASCDDLIDSPIDWLEIPQRPEDLAADRRVVGGLSGLLLV